MKRRSLFAFLLLPVIAGATFFLGCSSSPPFSGEAPPVDPAPAEAAPETENPPPPKSAPSPEERLLLRFANGASRSALEADGISPAGVAAILARRAGNDAFFVTADVDALGLSTEDRSRLDAAAALHATPDVACTVDAPRMLGAELFVTPDEGDAEIIARIDGAKKSIDVVMYTLTSFRIRDALLRAAGRGVSLRIILDRKHDDLQERIDTFVAAGAQAKPSSKHFTYTHQKTMVVDGRMLFVFTGNFDRLSFGSGRNFGAFLRDPEDVWDAEDLFDADWSGAKPNLSCTRLVVAPENALDRIVALVDAAQTTVEVEALYASDESFQDALVRAKKRGVTVRVLFNDPQFEVGDATDEAQLLSSAGIAVRRSPARFIHAKLVVVDAKRLFLGSENFSTNSITRNRELGVVLSKDEIDLKGVLDVFEKDFAAGTVFAE